MTVDHDRRFHRVATIVPINISVQGPNLLNEEDAMYIAERVVAHLMIDYVVDGELCSSETMTSLLSDKTSGETWLTTARNAIGILDDHSRVKSISAAFVTPHLDAPYHGGIQCFGTFHGDAVRDEIDISDVVVDNNGTRRVRYYQKEESEPGPQPSSLPPIIFGPPKNEGDRLEWRCGYDVIRVRFEDTPLSDLVEDDGSRHPVAVPFDIVDPDFRYEVGLKIAIPAWRVESNGWDSEIYTGEITAVGINHIEYNNFSHYGCSGSPVICVDDRFPQHRLKVIAIHAGQPKGHDFKIGFKTRCSHEKSFGREQATSTCWLFDVSKVLRGIQQMLLSPLHQPDRHS